MNRSTVAIVAVAALLLGSGASGLLFVKPALDQQAKLTHQKRDLTGQNSDLQAQVSDLESKLKGMAMGSISYFDLRTDPDQRRTLERKTVETLASLTEIFNDHHIRVQALLPKGELVGSNKPTPAPQPLPSGASPAPTAAPATPQPGVSPTEGPITLTNKEFQLQIRGEYGDLVKALTEIQGLPKAISINDYTLKLLQNPDSKEQPQPQPSAADVGPDASPTTLELTCDLTITFLMAGGAPAPASPGPSPAAAQHASLLQQLAFWASNSLVPPAEAAEDGSRTPSGIHLVEPPTVPPSAAPSAAASLKPVTVAPSPTPSAAAPKTAPAEPPKATARPGAIAKPQAAAPAAHVATKHQLEDVRYENGRLYFVTSHGTPHYTYTGVSPSRLVVDLYDTSAAEGAGHYLVDQGGIVEAQASPVTGHPGTLRVTIDTQDGVRLRAGLDPYHRLVAIAGAPAHAPHHPSHATTAHTAALPHAMPAKSDADAINGHALTHVESVGYSAGGLVVESSGGLPLCRIVGGNRKLLVLELRDAVIHAPGRLFAIGQGGIRQVRVAIYGHHPYRTRIAIETDGSVRLKPEIDANGRLRVASSPFEASVPAKLAAKASQPQPKPAAKPTKPQAKGKAAALQAAKPQPKPTPMATPAPAHPGFSALQSNEPHLTRSLTSSYAFPIDRSRVVGRQNPFRILSNRPLPAAGDHGDFPVVPKSAAHHAAGQKLPPLPELPAAGKSHAAAIATMAAQAQSYQLEAVLFEPGTPPLAVIKANSLACQVGLNDMLPGNARVKTIKPDYVVLLVHGQTLRLSLKR